MPTSVWTFDLLNGWLTTPRNCVLGIKMLFSGIPDEKESTALIVFLRTLSDHPVPLAEIWYTRSWGNTPAGEHRKPMKNF
jgi:cytochrome c